MQSPQSQQISLRFAEAWKTVSAERGVKEEFFKKYGIAKSNFFRAIRNVKNNKIDTYWMAAVVMEFSVSADWILTGRGSMIEKLQNNNSLQIPCK